MDPYTQRVVISAHPPIGHGQMTDGPDGFKNGLQTQEKVILTSPTMDDAQGISQNQQKEMLRHFVPPSAEATLPIQLAPHRWVVIGKGMETGRPTLEIREYGTKLVSLSILFL